MRSRPAVHGHRGARGLFPENTVASMRAAIAAGADGIELDVRLTGDGEVIVWHDPRVDAEKCRSVGKDLTGRRFDTLTLAQVRTLDVGSQTVLAFPEQLPAPGERVCTLDEIFAACADASAAGLWWTIEVKVDPTYDSERATRAELTEKVIASIRRAGLTQQSYLHSFDWAVLELGERVAPDVPRSALAEPGTWLPDSPWLGSVSYDAFEGDLPAAAAAVGASVVAPHFIAATPSLVQRAHDLGMRVMTWTVNEPANIRAAIEAGVDILCTDYPLLAKLELDALHA